MYPAACSSHSHLLLPGAGSRPPPFPTKSNKGPTNFKHQLSSVVQAQRDYLDDRSKPDGYSDRSEGAYSSKVPHNMQQQQPLPPRQPINNNHSHSGHRPGSGMPSTSYSSRPSYHSHHNNYVNPHRGQRQDNIELEDDVFSLTPIHV